jgi:hypothetical protein
MDNSARFLVDIMLARQSVGVAMMLVVLLFLWRNKPFTRAVWHDPSRFWRIVARGAAGAMVVALVWIGVFDNWLQLVSEPYRLSQRWESKRAVYAAIDPTIRTISVILLALALIGVAMLFARHVGGYGLQLGVMVIGILLWIPLFLMNGHVNSLFLQGSETSDTLLEAVGLGAFWVLLLTLTVATVLTTLTPITMAMALVATAILDLFHMRQPPITQEADGFFAELGNRAQERHDVPLKYFWKPHRRPL